MKFQLLGYKNLDEKMDRGNSLFTTEVTSFTKHFNAIIKTKTIVQKFHHRPPKILGPPFIPKLQVPP